MNIYQFALSALLSAGPSRLPALLQLLTGLSRPGAKEEKEALCATPGFLEALAGVAEGGTGGERGAAFRLIALLAAAVPVLKSGPFAERAVAALAEGAGKGSLDSLRCLSSMSSGPWAEPGDSSLARARVLRAAGAELVVNFRVGCTGFLKEHFLLSARVLTNVSGMEGGIPALLEFPGLLDGYMAALSAVPDDDSFQLLHALACSPEARAAVWAHPLASGSIVKALARASDDGALNDGNEYCTYALYQLAQDPVIREGLVNTPGLVPALCSDLWLLARLFIVAWTDEDDEATDEHGGVAFSHFCARPCRDHLRVVTVLLRADPSAAAATEHEGLELTPLQLARNGGFSDVALLVSRVAGEVAAGALGKGWSLQHVLGYSESEKAAVVRCRVTTLLCLRRRGWPRVREAGEARGDREWRRSAERHYNAHGADPWSIVLKFAF
jgi:hypothetical protein